jgi:hypothetical protein
MSPAQRPLPDKHTILTTDKRPCPRRDSNSQSQQASGCWDWQLKIFTSVAGFRMNVRSLNARIWSTPSIEYRRIFQRHGLPSIYVTRHRSVAAFCRHCNKASSYINGGEFQSSSFALMTRTETVLETVYSPFSHLTRLVAQRNFTEFSRRESFRLHISFICRFIGQDKCVHSYCWKL